MEVTPQIDARKARSEKTKARLEGKGYTVYTEHLLQPNKENNKCAYGKDCILETHENWDTPQDVIIDSYQKTLICKEHKYARVYYIDAQDKNEYVT